MWLHMVNGQCFRCLNIFQPALRHEIVIIQFAKTLSGCQSHFATRKKKDQKKKKKKASTRNTSCSSLARELNLATCSTWQWISQRASDSSCRPLTAARKSLSGLLLTEAQQLSEMFKGTIIQGLSSRPPHVRAEENLLRASRLWEGVCKLISESPNLSWLFYLSADLVLQPPEPSISCRR